MTRCCSYRNCLPGTNTCPRDTRCLIQSSWCRLPDSCWCLGTSIDWMDRRLAVWNCTRNCLECTIPYSHTSTDQTNSCRTACLVHRVPDSGLDDSAVQQTAGTRDRRRQCRILWSCRLESTASCSGRSCCCSNSSTYRIRTGFRHQEDSTGTRCRNCRLECRRYCRGTGHSGNSLGLLKYRRYWLKCIRRCSSTALWDRRWAACRYWAYQVRRAMDSAQNGNAANRLAGTRGRRLIDTILWWCRRWCLSARSKPYWKYKNSYWNTSTCPHHIANSRLVNKRRYLKCMYCSKSTNTDQKDSLVLMTYSQRDSRQRPRCTRWGKRCNCTRGMLNLIAGRFLNTA